MIGRSTSLKDISRKKNVNRNSAKYSKDKDENKSTRTNRQAKQALEEVMLFQRRYSEPLQGDVEQDAATGKKSLVADDLRMALMCIGIAPSKVFDDPRLQWFHNKYAVSDERESLNNRYHECLDWIRRRVAGKKIWTSLDVTVDPANGDLIGNVIIGTLSPNAPGETFLLAVGMLHGGDGKAVHGYADESGSGDACDVGQAAARLFDDAMCLLWPDGVRHSDVLLLLQSAAWPRRAERTADQLAAVYAKMVPVVCPASVLRAVAEQIYAGLPGLESLVTNVISAFSGNPALMCRLSARAPGIRPPPTPPSSSGQHWATAWIKAAAYLSENFRAVLDVLIDGADLQPHPGPVALARRLLASDPTLEASLAFVDSNYGFLPTAIARIEARDARLADTVAQVLHAADMLAEVAGDLGAAVNRRFADALRENHGFQTLVKIADVTAGRARMTTLELPENLCDNDLNYFRYAPVAAVDVRATFPHYQVVLSGSRSEKCRGDVDKTLIVQCNDFSAGNPSLAAF